MAKAKARGLGRGLDSLISDRFEEELKETPSASDNKKNESPAGESIVMLKLSRIETNKEQPRKQFDESALDELAQSVKEYGVIQPLLVQKKGKSYEIIAGERRFRAARKAGLKEVPVIIKDYSGQQVMEISLIENIQREDLNPIEEALAYQALQKEYGMKQDELAKRLSKSRAAVANTLRLLKLSSPVQDMLAEGLLTEGHARALLAVDKELQSIIAEKIVAGQWNVRQTEKYIKELQTEKKPAEKKPEDGRALAFRELEERTARVLGTKVRIREKSAEKGRIEIEYYSLEELERLTDLMAGSAQGE